MGTAEWRAAKSPAYYKRGDYVPGLKVRIDPLIAVICFIKNFCLFFLLINQFSVCDHVFFMKTRALIRTNIERIQGLLKPKYPNNFQIS